MSNIPNGGGINSTLKPQKASESVIISTHSILTHGSLQTESD